MGIIIDSKNYTSDATSQPLDWTTPISEIIRDDFVLEDGWATSHITIEDALSHRTGMPRHDAASIHKVNGRNATVKDIVRSLRHFTLNEPARTKWQYCNFMYVVASHIIETLTSRWLGDVLKEWLWQPLGMNSTYFSLEAALAAPEHFAGGYAWDRANQTFVAAPYMPTQEISGAGAVISSVDDYTKWLRALIHEAPPIPRAAHRAFKTPRLFMDPGQAVVGKGPPYDMPRAYAFGWIVTSYRGHRLWEHDGGMHAYGAEVYFFPDLEFGVVTLANTAMSSNFVGTILVWELVDDKLGVPKEERYDWAKSYEGWDRQIFDHVDGAVDRYYADRPTQGIPPSRPIEAYAGTYYDPGYGNFTLELADTKAGGRLNAKLVAKREDMTWQTLNEFEHVSGEFWMMYQSMLYVASSAFLQFAPAQFRTGSDGTVEALGITWISSSGAVDTIEGLVWFERVK